MPENSDSVGRTFESCRAYKRSNDLVADRFDCVPADVDAPLSVVDVFPLQRTAFTTAHTSGDNQFEIRLMQDTHGFQRLNQLFHRFIVRDLFLFLLSCVLVSAPRGIVINIAALHRVTATIP